MASLRRRRSLPFEFREERFTVAKVARFRLLETDVDFVTDLGKDGFAVVFSPLKELEALAYDVTRGVETPRCDAFPEERFELGRESNRQLG